MARKVRQCSQRRHPRRQGSQRRSGLQQGTQRRAASGEGCPRQLQTLRPPPRALNNASLRRHRARMVQTRLQPVAPKAASGAGRAVRRQLKSHARCRASCASCADPTRVHDFRGYSRMTIRVQGLFRERHWISPEHQDALISEIEGLKKRKQFEGMVFSAPAST